MRFARRPARDREPEPDLRLDELRYHPAWHDLEAPERLRAYELARALRRVEAALDPEGLSTTARAVLARLGTV